jgi:hemolysin activation/secretion protein
MFAADPAKAVASSFKLVLRVMCVMSAVLAVSAPAHSQQGSPAPAGSAPVNSGTQAPVKAFAILEFQIEGNTRLAVPDIERAVNDYLGENKSFKDIEGARGQLERVYHDHGYKTVIVNIPRQQISDGVVHLLVVEAPVGKLKILGSRYHSLAVIRDKVAQLDPGNVPEFGEVQKELGDVNRSADLRVTPVLKASETPGKVDVDLQVEDHLPLHALLEVNNRYSANTTHPRVVGEVHYDNLFQMNQSINLQVQVAPMLISDAKVASLSYVIPTSSGPVWALYAVYSDSNVAAVGNLDVLGKGNIYGIRWIDPLPTSSRDFYHSVTLGVDYKDFKQTVLLQDSGDSIESPVKYPAFSLDYAGSWLADAPAGAGARAATSGGRSSTSIDLNINFLIRGLGTDWREFANKRAYAGTSYIFLRPSITREQVLPAHWSLVGRIDGQLSSGPLINNEQFAAGGSESVRGYTEAERLGDDAIHGSLEFRTPQLLASSSTKIEQSYLALFAEAARLTIVHPLPSQDSGFSLASAGLALRFKAGGLYVALDGARTFKQGTVTEAARFRGLFRVSYSY